jgi:hypothetical protein
MAGRDFQAETGNEGVYFDDSAEDYFKVNHTKCINTKQN